MRAAIAIIALVAGCIRDEYTCAADADCNVGDSGRCEVDHHCTTYDLSCTASNRRYTDHSGASSGHCFDDSTALANPCAMGQPPATPTGCLAMVCSALPTCCVTGWSEACVLEAQRQACMPTCDTRIAITASRSFNNTELWDLRWNGSAWSATPRTADRSGPLVWLAPAPGQTEPRLAAFSTNGNAFVVDGPTPTMISVPTANNYLSAASVDFDRDGRDTVVLTYLDTGASNFVELVKLDAPTAPHRDVKIDVSGQAAWGDYDSDAFPDGVAAVGAAGASYEFMQNIEFSDHSRTVGTTSGSSFANTGNGTGEPATRSFAFTDVNGDGKLDLAGFGRSFRVHVFTPPMIDSNKLLDIDCAAPVIGQMASCMAPQVSTTFAGAPMPATPPGQMIIATSPQPAVYVVSMIGAGAAAISQPIPFSALPGGPMLAIVTRDLDGDHVLDIIAIDSGLHVWVALSKSRPFPTFVQQPNTMTTATVFNRVDVSVTGAPLP